MVTKKAFWIGFAPKQWTLVAVAFGLGWPCSSRAQCPGTITNNLVLQGDLTATASDTNPCIVVGADNLTINLNGHTLDVSALGDSAVAIDTGGHSGTTIVGNGGSIITAYASSAAASAIHASGGSATTITGVTMTNAPATCPTSGNQQANGFGTAIRIENASGASVTANQITFSGSNLPSGCKSSTGQLQDCSPALQLLQNASNNEINSGNQVRSNYGPGIYAQAGTSGNRITNNTALFNPTGDLWDDNPTRSNFWNKNTCGLEVGSVAPQKCP